MKTTVSVRGQTVVPRAIRERMGIVPQTKLKWQIVDGVIVVQPIPPDPVQAAVGILKGRGPTIDDLLAERQQERQREQGQGED
jgi:bifunctional DNA-binding transcriptional regulator/antitoxin component of YhaV-PrlF toxin-antitoxin module